MSQTMEYEPAATAPVEPTREQRHLAPITPLLIVAVFAAGVTTFIGWPTWPVLDAGERIAYSAIVAAVLACAASLVRCEWRRQGINAVAAAACVVPTMLPMVRPGDWTHGSLALWAAAVCVPVALLASATQRLRQRDATILPTLVTLGMAAASGALLLSTGSLKLGQAGLSLAAGVALVVVLGLLVRGIGPSAGTITVAFAIMAGLITSGRLWSELPLYAALCIFAAPVIAWIVRVPLLVRRRPWQRVVIVLLLAALPATAAVGIEAAKAQKASSASDDYGNYNY